MSSTLSDILPTPAEVEAVRAIDATYGRDVALWLVENIVGGMELRVVPWVSQPPLYPSSLPAVSAGSRSQAQAKVESGRLF